jgi:hypothetical protein
VTVADQAVAHPTGPDLSRDPGWRAAALAALPVWLATRLGLVVLTVGAAFTVSGAGGRDVEGFLKRWDRWDVGLFRKVAEFGYQGYPVDYPDRGVEAFFPGMLLVMRAVHVLVPSWTAAGLLVSLLAGAVASVALARLGALEGLPPGRAVLYLTTSPYAVFLFAGYSESLFLALALSGWLCARRDQWVAAGVLVGLACTVRVSGAFLAAGLVVDYLVRHRGRLRWDAAALLLPGVALLGYAAYLHSLTGDWMRWQHAQEEGWGRRFSAPWDTFETTLNAARNLDQGADFLWSFRAEIVAVGVGIALTVALLALRRWGEATYVGLSVTALATSTFYLSVARATLLWFPLFLLVAHTARRWPWVHGAYLAVCAPLMAVLVIAFTSGRWVG